MFMKNFGATLLIPSCVDIDRREAERRPAMRKEARRHAAKTTPVINAIVASILKPSHG